MAYFRLTEGFLNLDDEPIYLKIFFEGELLARWTIFMRYEITRAKVVLPRRLMAGKTSCRLEIHPENPQSAERILIAKGQRPVSEDPRELSIKVQQIKFAGSERLLCALDKTIEFTNQGDGAWHLDECWTNPDDLGSWTLGPEASLDLVLPDPVDGLINAVFTDYRRRGYRPVSRARRHRRHERSRIGNVDLPQPVHRAAPDSGARPHSDAQRPARITFRVATPRTPKQLGWRADDRRPLGIRLTRLRLSAAGSERYRLGEVIDFAEGGNAITFIGDTLGSQWTSPDPFGSWTIGVESVMKIDFESPPSGDLPAAFVISDCNIGGEAALQLAVRVKANGQTCGRMAFGSGTRTAQAIGAHPGGCDDRFIAT